jgi:DnaJ-class molecular chaperone
MVRAVPRHGPHPAFFCAGGVERAEMTDTPDYYAILRVRADAGQQEISRAYRALMRSHHPDVDGGTAPEGELLRIMQAFNILRDPERRAAYDKQRAASAPQAIPVRKVHTRGGTSGHTIRITPVRWESGPWS